MCAECVCSSDVCRCVQCAGVYSVQDVCRMCAGCVQGVCRMCAGCVQDVCRMKQ